MPDHTDKNPAAPRRTEALNPVLDRLWKIFTSLRLTVTCLAFGIVLVWVGTVAQADEGLYQAQARYFKHWIVWGATLWGHRVPLLLPGGYLLGTVLLANLIAAHVKRFKFTKKQVGINLTHFGVILLLVGQLTTDMLSRESHLRLKEGETKSFSEVSQSHELVFTHDAGNGREEVVAIPYSFVAKGGTITHEKLPFGVRVNRSTPNADIVQPDKVVEAAAKITPPFAMVEGEYASPEGLTAQAERTVGTQGEGRAVIWREALKAVGEKDTKNIVEATKRVVAQPERAAKLCTELKSRFHAQMGDAMIMQAEIAHEGDSMRVAVDRVTKKEPVTLEALPVAATNGAGKSYFLAPAPETKDMESNNFPAAVIEIAPGGQSIGSWLVSPLLRAQKLSVGGQDWHVSLRAERIYHPFSMKLLKATHEIYHGTATAGNREGIPKNFQSRVRIENPATFENREVDIYMNNPLRYAGLTFYQYQMSKEEMSSAAGFSTLQVVRNPSWITPYLGCLIVALGMIWQFMYHLLGFIAKRRTATATAAAL